MRGGTILLKKQPMSLKQFMLRTEILKLYRGFMRLGRNLDVPPSPELPSADANNISHNNSKESSLKTLHPLQLEWINWVRSEFRIRKETTDDEVIRMMLAQGKRQLQEMERTISLATNKNLISSSSQSGSSCSNQNQTKNVDKT